MLTTKTDFSIFDRAVAYVFFFSMLLGHFFDWAGIFAGIVLGLLIAREVNKIA